MLTQYDELRAARGRTLALEHDTTQEMGDYGGRVLRTDSSLFSKSGNVASTIHFIILFFVLIVYIISPRI
jgi:hypothetical protein